MCNKLVRNLNLVGTGSSHLYRPSGHVMSGATEAGLYLRVMHERPKCFVSSTALPRATACFVIRHNLALVCRSIMGLEVDR